MAQICQILSFKKNSKSLDSYNKFQKDIQDYRKIQLCSYIKVDFIN
jgi:hypothetical protein